MTERFIVEMNNHRKPLLNSSGFTLVELMMVLAVIAILVTVAAPAMSNMVSSNRVSSAAYDLITALNLAKNEAVRSGNRVVMCKSPDGTHCDADAGWSDGWIVFRDANSNEAVDDNEQIINVHAALNASLNFNYVDGDFIAFKANGRINEQGRFCFRNENDPEKSKAVIIILSGRFRTEERNADNNCAV